MLKKLFRLNLAICLFSMTILSVCCNAYGEENDFNPSPSIEEVTVDDSRSLYGKLNRSSKSIYRDANGNEYYFDDAGNIVYINGGEDSVKSPKTGDRENMAYFFAGGCITLIIILLRGKNRVI